MPNATLITELSKSVQPWRTEVEDPERSDRVQKLMKMADDYAQVYSLDDLYSEMGRRRNELREAIITALIDAEVAALPAAPNIRVSSRGMVVDQNYHWNYDMKACPSGKVQLLSIGGVAFYGMTNETVSGFCKAWAPLPKD